MIKKVHTQYLKNRLGDMCTVSGVHQVSHSLSLHKVHNSKKDTKSIEYGWEVTNEGLMDVIKSIIAEKGSCNWIDLGCGQQIAQREAKQLLDLEGIGHENLNIVGYDALPVRKSIRNEVFDPDSGMGQGDFARPDKSIRNYSGEVYRKNIETVEFSLEPDLVTARDVVQWLDDPLAMVTNALNQTPVGAIVAMNKFNRIGAKTKRKNAAWNNVLSNSKDLISEYFTLHYWNVAKENGEAILERKKVGEIDLNLTLRDFVEPYKHYDWGTAYRGKYFIYDLEK